MIPILQLRLIHRKIRTPKPPVKNFEIQFHLNPRASVLECGGPPPLLPREPSDSKIL